MKEEGWSNKWMEIYNWERQAKAKAKTTEAKAAVEREAKKRYAAYNKAHSARFQALLDKLTAERLARLPRPEPEPAEAEEGAPLPEAEKTPKKEPEAVEKETAAEKEAAKKTEAEKAAERERETEKFLEESIGKYLKGFRLRPKTEARPQ
jgi:hypothetical protein